MTRGLFGAIAPVAAVLTALAAHAAPQSDGAKARSTLQNAEGQQVGTAILVETPAGVLVTLQLSNIAPGEHAFHIHENGRCEAPFTSAGGHFNPGGHKHGFLASGEPHAGDMPNLHVPDGGKLTVEVLNPRISLKAGADDSAIGKAFIIHAGKDDYRTDPAGDAGGRIACGLIEAQG